MAFYALILWLVLLAACKPVERPIFEPSHEAPPSAPDKHSDIWIAPPTTIVKSSPSPAPSPPPTPAPPVFGLPEAPVLTDAGEALIIEFEVGGQAGYDPRPELPDLRLSGVTWGIGYDAHQNSASAILNDWNMLPVLKSQRLAATHPFYGRLAVDPAKAVRDILIAWPDAMDVFNRLDVSRTMQQCRRAFLDFDGLRPNAQAALVSLVFNRGNGMVGANRTEMRGIRDLVPRQDYNGIAGQLRKMERVWIGTSIERGMTRRREAEARLVLTP